MSYCAEHEMTTLYYIIEDDKVPLKFLYSDLIYRPSTGSSPFGVDQMNFDSLRDARSYAIRKKVTRPWEFARITTKEVHVCEVLREKWDEKWTH